MRTVLFPKCKNLIELNYPFKLPSERAFRDETAKRAKDRVKSREMEAEIKELNRFLVSFELEGAGFSGYRRLFHEGDVEGFDFQWFGFQ